MNTREREEFAVMKNEITHIKTDVTEMKELLKEHMGWEEVKYENLKQEFASKWVESLAMITAGAFITGIVGAIMFLFQ